MSLASNDAFSEFSDSTRVYLLHRLDELFNSCPVSRELYAFLWLADVDKLREIVAQAETNPSGMESRLHDSVGRGQLIQRWTQKAKCRPNSAASTPSVQPLTPLGQTDAPLGPAPSPPPSGSRRRRDGEIHRDANQTALCVRRDSNRCVITGSGYPVIAAHIFPFAMRYEQSAEAQSRNINNFWHVLRMFWSDEKVDRWYTAIASTTETVKNLICFCPNVHRYQENAYFALKPLDEDPEGLRLPLEFVWLPRFKNPPQVRLKHVPIVANITDSRQNNDEHLVKLYNVYTDTRIRTGDVIVVETSDKQQLPLPDRHLLEMQWALQRVAAISAGAEPVDVSYSDDLDDDPYPYLSKYASNNDDDVAEILSIKDDGTQPMFPSDLWKVDFWNSMYST